MAVFRYAHGSDQLLGVGPWLVPLYFAFGVVAALLGEVTARPRVSADGAGRCLHYP